MDVDVQLAGYGFELGVQHLVVWLFLELQSSDVLQHVLDLLRNPRAEVLYRSGQLPLHNLLVFLFFIGSLEILPRQTALEEVYQHVDKAFKIVSAGLLNANVGVN